MFHKNELFLIETRLIVTSLQTEPIMMSNTANPAAQNIIF